MLRNYTNLVTSNVLLLCNFASLQYALPMACYEIRSIFFVLLLSLVNLMTMALGQWTCPKREQVCLQSMVYFLHMRVK